MRSEVVPPPFPEVSPVSSVTGFIPPGQSLSPVPPVTPPPLPVTPDLYFLPNNTKATKSEILSMNNPDLLIWHPRFGPEWRPVKVVFPS